MMTLHYAREKVDASVSTLAEHPGPIRDRLWDAWISQMSHLSMMPANDAVPASIVDRLRRLEEKATDRGPYRDTFDTMPEDEAVDMARELVALQYELSELSLELGPLA